MKYSALTSIRKGILDGLKTCVAADVVLGGITDPEKIEAHIAAITTGAITGIIRGIANWWKNRKR